MNAEIESEEDMPGNKIFLLSKCVELRFAEMLFYDGILHFGYPSNWIKKAEEGNGRTEGTDTWHHRSQMTLWWQTLA